MKLSTWNCEWNFHQKTRNNGRNQRKRYIFAFFLVGVFHASSMLFYALFICLKTRCIQILCIWLSQYTTFSPICMFAVPKSITAASAAAIAAVAAVVVASWLIFSFSVYHMKRRTHAWIFHALRHRAFHPISFELLCRFSFPHEFFLVSILHE